MEHDDHIPQKTTNRSTSRAQGKPIATAARYDSRMGRVIVALSSRVEIMFKPGDIQGLENAQANQLHDIKISPSGMGLHFPALDADVYLPGLLRGHLGSEEWTASRMGRVGGLVSTPAKAAAARLNGRRGGRPRKDTNTDFEENS